MKQTNTLIKLVCLSFLSVSTAYATNDNFNCPQPNEIQSTDFTSPSIWTAPPVAHSAEGTVGLGLGGKNVKEFLGAEAALVGHKKGWVCVYKSEGGVSVNEYEYKIREAVEKTPYLKQYLGKVNEQLDKAEPYLKKYPKNTPIGFIGYQAATE